MIQQKTWSFGIRLVKTGSSRSLVRKEESVCEESGKRKEKREVKKKRKEMHAE